MRDMWGVNRESMLRHTLEGIEKSRIRDDRSIRASDFRFAFRSERGDRKRHGDAMIAERINFPAVELLAAGDPQAIVPLFNLGAQGAQVGRHCRDAV